jgi:hydrogenase maturation factor
VTAAALRSVSACAGDHCITCADDGVPMAVVRLDEARGLALCEDGEGERHTVETALVEPLVAGRVVLVHAGVAIAALEQENPPADFRATCAPRQGAVSA